MLSGWSLGKGRIQDGPNNLAFVNDPFPDKPVPIASTVNTSGPVLQTTYSAGSFSSNNSGAQWYNLWNTSDGSTFGTMMVTYEVAFDAGFDWMKGGKLPGLRGGLNSTGCSGGNEATGQDCFSSRVMWRKNSAGEGMCFSIPANQSSDWYNAYPQSTLISLHQITSALLKASCAILILALACPGVHSVLLADSKSDVDMAPTLLPNESLLYMKLEQDYNACPPQ